MRRLVVLCTALALSLLPVAAASAAPAPPGHPLPATTTVTTTSAEEGMGRTVTAHAVAPRGGREQASPGDYLFNCIWGAGYSWTATGPTVYYWSTFSCSAGTPIRTVSVMQSAHVNTPTVFNVAASIPYPCNGANPCNSPQEPFDARATQLLEGCALAQVQGTDGLLYDLPQLCNASYPFNNQGAGYPGTPSYVLFQIPFPGPSYTQCDDFPLLHPTCPRNALFPQRVKDYYATKSWPIPTCPPNVTLDAHHIKPLHFGGGNSGANGVLLCHPDHVLFTNWWEYGRFTPN